MVEVERLEWVRPVLPIVSGTACTDSVPYFLLCGCRRNGSNGFVEDQCIGVHLGRRDGLCAVALVCVCRFRFAYLSLRAAAVGNHILLHSLRAIDNWIVGGRLVLLPRTRYDKLSARVGCRSNAEAESSESYGISGGSFDTGCIDKLLDDL